MKYFKVTVKFGHVGKNNYYKGTLFVVAESKKDAAARARFCPRVKHDQKDAILAVEEIDRETFLVEDKANNEISFFSCYNIQQQRAHICEIEKDIYQEEWVEKVSKKTKKHSLRKTYNLDPDFEQYKNLKDLNSFVA